MNLRDTYNKIAAEWHKDHQKDDWWIGGTDKFISLLKSNDSILDVGCGGGTKAKYLSKGGLDVLGIDFSENLIEIAKKEVPEAKFMVLDMYDIEGLSQEFDGIFAQASLLHVPKNDILKVLRIFFVKLKNNGLLYIAVKGARADGVEEETKEENDYGYPYQRFFSYFSVEELSEAFNDLGLKIIYKESKEVGKTEWIQIIGRKEA